MPAPRDSVAVLKTVKTVFGALLVLTLLPAAGITQTSLNDVHVVPREMAPALASPALARNVVASSQLVGGTMLHVIKTDVKLVLVPVSVTDPRQRLVTGLRPENFELFEGKKSQEIRHFSSEDVPVSVGIILDASGSMADKMNRVRDAVHQFCDEANPQDEFFMIVFSDQPRLSTDFTTAPEDLQKELVFTQPKGRTALLDAIYMGLHKMKEARYGKKALLIISDGGDNHSRYGEREVKAAAKESDVMIYAIGTFDRYVPTLEERRGPALLDEIAEPTGGRAFTLENTMELPSVARHIGRELRTQYVLGYRPEQLPKDGKWHKIQVKLRLPKKLSFLRARAKTGYYAPAE
jgi:Ca-activated chloride channel family protein